MDKHHHLSQLEPVKDAHVVESSHCQHRHTLLLPQHTAGSAAQTSQQPYPSHPCGGATPHITIISTMTAVADVAQQRQQKEESRPNVGATHDPGHRLGVDGVRGEQQAGQRTPNPPTQQQAGQPGEEARHGPMEAHVDQVVAPGIKATQSMVEAEGERAERPVGLVAAAVGKQGAPEVVIEDVGPGGLRKEVLVGFDRTAAEEREKERGRKKYRVGERRKRRLKT